MSTSETTTIELNREIWRELHNRKQGPGDSFNNMVERLLDE